MSLPTEGHLGILPQGGLPAGCLPSRVEWMQGTHHNLPAQVPCQSISLTRGGSIYLEFDIPQPMAEDPDWKALPLDRCLCYPNSQPPQDHSPKTRKRGQHDNGGKESPVSGNVTHIWSCVRELDPKKTKPCGCTHASTPQAERSLQAGGHLIPSEHPNQMTLRWQKPL